MAPYKGIFAILIIIKCIATSSAFGRRNRIVPWGAINVAHGDGTLTAGFAGRNLSPLDQEINRKLVIKRPNPWGGRTYIVKKFKTANGEKIYQVHVRDADEDPTPGGVIGLMSGGPGTTEVKLSFVSEPDYGIRTNVILYGEHEQ